MLKPTKPRLKVIEPVVVDLDARPLGSGLQHRVAVVTADTPDNDPAALRNSVSVQAAQGRVVLPPAAAGANEARLYYIPQFHTAYVVAARAPIQVEAGAPDATEASHLLRDATFGRAKFDAMYAGRALTVEGQLLRAEPRSASEIDAVPALRNVVAGGSTYMALAIGWTEPWAAPDGAPGEVQCVIPADDSAIRQ